jgi:hypothetical protein
VSPTDAAPSVTDWLSAWGQIAGAIAIVLAVVVALWIASRDRRRADRDRGEEAQHRAARVASTLYGPVVTITNHGAAPIWQPDVVSCVIPELPDVVWKRRVHGAAREVLGSADAGTGCDMP